MTRRTTPWWRLRSWWFLAGVDTGMALALWARRASARTAPEPSR